MIRSGKIVFAAFLAACCWLGSADARGLCGDDVGGARVACGCGDVVVSDTALRADDPVVLERCNGDGLIVRAPKDAATIRLSLGGQSLVGTGSGSGIRVIAGGRDGAVIEGGEPGARGTVAGFGSGIRASGRRSVSEVRSIDFKANTRDGVALWGMQLRLVDVIAENNGRDGVHVGGREPQVEGVRADRNARYGIRVTGPNARVEDDDARGNRRGNVLADPRSRVESR